MYGGFDIKLDVKLDHVSQRSPEFKRLCRGWQCRMEVKVDVTNNIGL